FRHPALVKTGNAHGQQCRVVIGSHFEGLLKMRHGFFELPALVHSQPQTVFYDDTRRGDCERVLKQSEAVIPPMNLRVRESSKNQENPQSYSCAEQWRNAPTLGDVR